MQETTLKMPFGIGDPAVHDYPPEKKYTKFGLGFSLGFHVLVLVVVGLIAYWQHIRSLSEMMTASVPSALPDQMEIVLIDDKKEPPPTDHPEWIYQVITPKVKPPPPPPPPPKPKPHPQFVRAAPPKLNVGSSGLPSPDYPMEAYRSHITGTLLLRVSFDGAGGVTSAEVVTSSGSSVLDSHSRHYVMDNWHDASFAGQTQTVPIRYQLKTGQ
jgi:TonB family protein